MNNIPFNLLPRALRKTISLPNIAKIEIQHAKNSPMMKNTFVFMKKFGPIIKFHNQHLEFKRTLSKNAVPVYSLFDANNVQIAQFEAGPTSAEEILAKIESLNGGNTENATTAQETTEQKTA